MNLLPDGDNYTETELYGITLWIILLGLLALFVMYRQDMVLPR